MNFNSQRVKRFCVCLRVLALWVRRVLYVWFYKSIGTWQVIYRKMFLFYAIVEI